MRIWNKDTKVDIGFQFDSATRYNMTSGINLVGKGSWKKREVGKF